MAKHFGSRARKSRFSTLRRPHQRLPTNRSELEPIASSRTARIAREMLECQWLHSNRPGSRYALAMARGTLGKYSHGRLFG